MDAAVGKTCRRYPACGFDDLHDAVRWGRESRNVLEEPRDKIMPPNPPYPLRWLGWFVSICLLVAPRQARAQNRGAYPLGMSATNSGATPESGFSYTNQLLSYGRNQAKDDEGR